MEDKASTLINSDKNLIVSSKDFIDGGKMQTRNTGFGEDLSPEFILQNLNSAAESLAIIMDDLDIPMVSAYNHWIIWNLPVSNVISGSIPAGEKVVSLGNAVQGIGYGNHQYRGPKQPIFVRNTHRYTFHIYTLDSKLDLSPASRKEALLVAMQGHILQEGTITGTYKRADRKK